MDSNLLNLFASETSELKLNFGVLKYFKTKIENPIKTNPPKVKAHSKSKTEW